MTAKADVIHRFNPYLHGARGLFAFMIVVFHVVNSRLPTLGFLASGWPLFCARTLEHGVELFFGISGIVIVGALSRARGPLLFAVERGTRIYPVLWASVACIVLLSGLTGYEGRGLPSAGVFVANLLALPPLAPIPLIHPAAWSLSYELAFYGFCALAWALRRRLGWLSLVLIIPAGALGVGAHVRVALMPVGMGVAVLMARRPRIGRYVRAPGLCLLGFLLLWEAVCEGSGGDLTPLGVLDLSAPLLAVAALAILAAAASFIGILEGEGLFGRLLATAPLQFLGSISYSLYLWHPIVMSIVKHAMYVAHLPQHLGAASQLVFFALSLPPSILLAWGSQRLLEKRVTVFLRRRIERLMGHQPRRPAPITVAHSAAARLPLEHRP